MLINQNNSHQSALKSSAVATPGCSVTSPVGESNFFGMDAVAAIRCVGRARGLGRTDKRGKDAALRIRAVWHSAFDRWLDRLNKSVLLISSISANANNCGLLPAPGGSRELYLYLVTVIYLDKYIAIFTFISNDARSRGRESYGKRGCDSYERATACTGCGGPHRAYHQQ